VRVLRRLAVSGCPARRYPGAVASPGPARSARPGWGALIGGVGFVAVDFAGGGAGHHGAGTKRPQGSLAVSSDGEQLFGPQEE
jgi:hypothetical protein